MAIYFVILFVLAFSLCFKSHTKYVFVFLLFLLAVIGASRSITVGTDNEIYCLNFNSTTANTDSWSEYTEFEPGFNYLIVFFKTYISKDYYVFMSFLYIVWIIAYYKYVKFFRVGYLLPLFIGYCLCFITTPYNIMRQSFALSLYSFILPLLMGTKRERFFYVVLCLTIGMLFHRSLVVLSLLVFLFHDRVLNLFYKKKIIITILIISFFANFLSSYLLSFLSDYMFFFQLLGDRYAGYIRNASLDDERGSRLSAMLETFMSCVAVSSLNKKDRFYTLYVMFICLYLVLQNVLGSIFVIFMRIAYNFQWIWIFVYTTILKDRNKKYCCWIDRLIILYCLVIFIKAILKNFGDIVPYVVRF